MTFLIKMLGILGGLCFAYCGVPAAFLTAKTGRSIGTPIVTAWLIVFGGIFMYSYMTLTYGLDLLLTANYTVESISWAIIVYFHYFPRTLTVGLGIETMDETKLLSLDRK